VQSGYGKRLIQIFEDVVDVFNSDAEPDHFRQNSRDALFFQ
jgi:hypothetical protein